MIVIDVNYISIVLRRIRKSSVVESKCFGNKANNETSSLVVGEMR